MPALLISTSTRPKRSIALGDETLTSGLVGDVSGDGDRPGSSAARRSRRSSSPSGDHDPSPDGVEHPGEVVAETRRRTGHDGDPAVESEPVEGAVLGRRSADGGSSWPPTVRITRPCVDHVDFMTTPANPSRCLLHGDRPTLGVYERRRGTSSTHLGGRAPAGGRRVGGRGPDRDRCVDGRRRCPGGHRDPRDRDRVRGELGADRPGPAGDRTCVDRVR